MNSPMSAPASMAPVVRLTSARLFDWRNPGMALAR